MDRAPSGYRDFFEAVDQFQALKDLSLADAANQVMTLCVMAMATNVPSPLRSALSAAVDLWYVGSSVAPPAEPFRVACWQYLDRKNGDSITIADQVDIAVRSLICVLHEASEIEDLDLTMDFFGGLLDRTDLDVLSVAGLHSDNR